MKNKIQNPKQAIKWLEEGEIVGVGTEENKAVIFDALCACGHWGYYHNSLLGFKGHGNCKKCNCRQFTLKKFIEKEVKKKNGTTFKL